MCIRLNSRRKQAIYMYHFTLKLHLSTESKDKCMCGGVAQRLERRSMTGELSLACAMTCS